MDEDREKSVAGASQNREKGNGASSDDSYTDDEGVRFEHGLEIVGLKGDDDPLSPMTMSSLRKWFIVLNITSATLCVTCASSMVALTYPGVMSDFDVGHEVATLSLTLFIFGLGIGPMFLAPLSEFYGRQPIYVISYFIYVAFNFGVAFAPNIETLVICRFFDGLAGSAFLSVAGGTVSDIFAPSKVAKPMGVYTAGPFFGPIVGPVISGFINQHTTWRWTWWTVIIWASVQLVAIIFFTPETYLPALLVKKARKLRKQGRPDVVAPLELDKRSVLKVVLWSCIRPFEIMALEPMALLLCIWSAILLGLLYMSFTAWGYVYGGVYGFNTQEVGLSYIGLGVGVGLGVATQSIWLHYNARAVKKHGILPPEEHLRRGLVGAAVAPISLFWMAWTTFPSIHWIVSEIPTVFFAFSATLSFQASFTYLVSAYRPFAASAMAANSFLRSSSAAAFPLFTRQMFEALGNQWALTLCAFLCLAIAPAPFVFFWKGAQWRRSSKFTPEGQELLEQQRRSQAKADWDAKQAQA